MHAMDRTGLQSYNSYQFIIWQKYLQIKTSQQLFKNSCFWSQAQCVCQCLWSQFLLSLTPRRQQCINQGFLDLALVASQCVLSGAHVKSLSILCQSNLQSNFTSRIHVFLLDSKQSHYGQHTAAPQNVGHVPQWQMRQKHLNKVHMLTLGISQDETLPIPGTGHLDGHSTCINNISRLVGWNIGLKNNRNHQPSMISWQAAPAAVSKRNSRKNTGPAILHQICI